RPRERGHGYLPAISRRLGLHRGVSDRARLARLAAVAHRRWYHGDDALLPSEAACALSRAPNAAPPIVSSRCQRESNLVGLTGTIEAPERPLDREKLAGRDEPCDEARRQTVGKAIAMAVFGVRRM